LPVVTTGTISAPVPGVWRRLSLLSQDGGISGLADEHLIGQLEDVGIPRHQHAIVDLLLSWQRARIPPDVALALWLLREQEDGNGLIYRRAGVPVEESSPAIRYIQLAAEVGETRESDPTLRRVVARLLDHQLPDGSIPLTVATGLGAIGQTARTLRALHKLGDPALAGRLAALTGHLQATALAQPTGVAWALYSPDRTVVTGSTSLAITALVERGVRGAVIDEGLRYLLAAQEPDGGWAEVPGYRPTIQNTYQVVRAVRTAQRAGLLDPDRAHRTLDRARGWFRRATRRQPDSVLEHAFAVRTAVELDLLRDRRSERLAYQLSQSRRQFLDPQADLYADTALAAIALLEASRAVDPPGRTGSWPWRWQLPNPTPPFLVRGPYFYELLYGVLWARWWVRLVDLLIRRRVVDRAAGLLLGAVTSIGIISDYVVDSVAAGGALRGSTTIAIVFGLVVCWLAIKSAARSSVLAGLRSSGGALLVAAPLSLVLDPADPVFPGLVVLIGLRWLVIDVVAFTADSSGLLERLLPRT
jgi:hypothetical protein